MRELRIDGRTIQSLGELRTAVVRAVGADATVGHTVDALTELLALEPVSLTWDHSADSERVMGATFGRVVTAWRDLEARDPASFKLALR